MKHRSWIFVSFALWFWVGSFLLYKGIFYIAQALTLKQSLAAWGTPLFGSPEKVGGALLIAALMLGFFKGQFVLAKTARKLIGRIHSQPLPIRIQDVYPKGYWLLIAAMIGLGVLMRYLPLPVDVRGFVDVAVGTALARGSFFYFRALFPRASAR